MKPRPAPPTRHRAPYCRAPTRPPGGEWLLLPLKPVEPAPPATMVPRPRSGAVQAPVASMPTVSGREVPAGKGDPRDPRQLRRPPQGPGLARPAPALGLYCTPTSGSWLNAVKTSSRRHPPAAQAQGLPLDRRAAGGDQPPPRRAQRDRPSRKTSQRDGDSTCIYGPEFSGSAKERPHTPLLNFAGINARRPGRSLPTFAGNK
jgi:hypothetical protein